MTKSRSILPKRTYWSPEQLELLREHYPHKRTDALVSMIGRNEHSIYSKANQLGIKKTDEYMNSPDACRLRQGDNVGAAYRFPKGHVPANKGKKGISYPGAEATQFKKGQKPHTWKPIGTERLSKEGYLQRKMTDTGCTRRDYVPVHHIVWKEAGREIPKGFHLTFKDGNKTNITLKNLELVSYADMMKRNSFHQYPKEIARMIQLRGALTRQINKKEKQLERA